MNRRETAIQLGMFRSIQDLHHSYVEPFTILAYASTRIPETDHDAFGDPQWDEFHDRDALLVLETHCGGRGGIRSGIPKHGGEMMAILSSFLDLQATTLSLFRADALMRERMNFELHVEQLQIDGTFENTFRMSLLRFRELANLLRQRIDVNVEMSIRRTRGKRPISAEITVLCGIRYLAGGSYLDIRNVAQVSIPSFYRAVHRFFQAVLSCNELRIALPGYLSDDFQLVRSGFSRRSTDQAFDGCVGSIDGCLIPIRTPSLRELQGSSCTPRSFFSGHYQKYGLNAQAICDSNFRFLFFSVAAPGGSNDFWALQRSSLATEWINGLPPNHFIVGDKAYICSEKLLTPFPSVTANSKPERDAYNYYLSQLRIHVEQAFGLLGRKWSVLKDPLQMKLENACDTIMVAVRLHNFVLAGYTEDEITASLARTTLDRDGTVTIENHGVESLLPSDLSDIGIVGDSIMRHCLVVRLQRLSLTRPNR